MVEQITQLKLSTIVKNPYQPRLVFDGDKLKELANSIKENGVLQPIIVRKSKLVGYELLAGVNAYFFSPRQGPYVLGAFGPYVTRTDVDASYSHQTLLSFLLGAGWKVSFWVENAGISAGLFLGGQLFSTTNFSNSSVLPTLALELGVTF